MGETTATRREVWVFKNMEKCKTSDNKLQLCLGGVNNYASKGLVYTVTRYVTFLHKCYIFKQT